MRLTKERADENRSQILEAATQLFCLHGFDAVSVAQLMHAAGFTHGGFYNHFSSKEALAAEACASAFARSQAELASALRGGSRKAWQLLAAKLLSREPRPALSCVGLLAALAIDASRQGAELQATFAQGVEGLLETLSTQLGGEAGPRTRQARQLAVQRLSELVGACVLARTVVGSRPALSDEILNANRARWAIAGVRSHASRARRRAPPRR